MRDKVLTSSCFYCGVGGGYGLESVNSKLSFLGVVVLEVSRICLRNPDSVRGGADVGLSV